MEYVYQGNRIDIVMLLKLYFSHMRVSYRIYMYTLHTKKCHAVATTGYCGQILQPILYMDDCEKHPYLFCKECHPL